MNKLILTILAGLSLGTNAFALSSINFAPASVNQIDYTNEITFSITPIIDIDEILYMYYPDGSMAYSCENTLACENTNLAINSFFTFFQLGNITGIVVDATNIDYATDCDSNTLSNCLNSTAFIANIGTVFTMSVLQVATALFSFIPADRTATTSEFISTNIVGGVSNLWPIILVIVGLLLTFYILEQIIKIFAKNLKEKKEYEKFMNKKADNIRYDEHGNVKSISFTKK